MPTLSSRARSPGNVWWGLWRTRWQKNSHPPNPITFIWLPLCYFIPSCRLSLAFLNAQMHHISLALTILLPHLLPRSPQSKSRKIAFITAAWLKGTFVNVAWFSVSTDAFSGPTRPLAMLRVPLSTCTPPSSPRSLWISSPLAWSFSVLGSFPVRTSSPDGSSLNLVHLSFRYTAPPAWLQPSPRGNRGAYWGIAAVCCSFPITWSSSGRRGGGIGEETQEDESGLLTSHDVTRAHAGLH